MQPFQVYGQLRADGGQVGCAVGPLAQRVGEGPGLGGRTSNDFTKMLDPNVDRAHAGGACGQIATADVVCIYHNRLTFSSARLGPQKTLKSAERALGRLHGTVQMGTS